VNNLSLNEKRNDCPIAHTRGFKPIIGENAAVTERASSRDAVISIVVEGAWHVPSMHVPALDGFQIL
jgi:hypothetical protein